MKVLIEDIELLQEEIFNGSTAEYIQKIINISEDIQNLLPSLNKDKQNHIIELLKHLVIALDNKDYLLVADILEYEFKVLLKTL